MKTIIFLGVVLVLLGGCATVPHHYIGLRDKMEKLSVKQAEQDLILRSVIGTQRLILNKIQERNSLESSM